LLASYVEQTFQKYADGATMTDLRDWLKAHNIKNSMGGEMSYNTIQRMLSNRRYIGELRLRDVVQPNAIPALVSEDLFNKVQEKLAKNKKAPARHKAEESYLLTTKLYCGKCGALMFGESGVSHTGKMYTYYKCAAAKKKKTCDKKAVRKQWLEDLVVKETMKLVEDDASMNAIIAKVMELQNQESTDLPIYEKQLKETEVGITNMLNAIQMGILTSSTKERLEALEDQRKELQARIAEERLAKPKMKEEFVRFWLLRFRKLDMTQPEQRQALVDTFINAIYLYDDKVLITFNYKEGTETVAFGEAVKAEKSSDMSARGAPDFERQIVRFGVLFCYVTPKNRGLHGQCTVFARSAFSWESSAWAGIALKSVVNFASSQQSQTELRLYFGVCMVIASALYSGAFRQQVHPVSAPTEGDFPQCGEIFQREKINCCPLRLIFPVHISTCQSFQQLRRLNIHQFYLICLIKGGIRNALPHKNSGDRGHCIVETLDMLDIYSRIDINSSI